MTIGFGMIDPVLNEPRYPWYQKRNHVRIPKKAESKKYLDAAFAGGEAVPDWTEDTFPTAVFGAFPGHWYDPLNPANSTASNGSAATGVQPVNPGEPVAFVLGRGVNVSNVNPAQSNAALCGALAVREGKTGIAFNGVDQYLSRIDSLASDWSVLPQAVTFFSTFWQDADKFADGCPIAMARGETSNSYIRLIVVNPTVGKHAHVRFNSTAFITDTTIPDAPTPLGQWNIAFGEMDVTTLGIGVDGTGTFTMWTGTDLDGSVAVAPITTGLAVTAINRVVLGSALSGTTPNNFFQGIVGRSGIVMGKLDDAGRAALVNWMKGTVYVP